MSPEKIISEPPDLQNDLQALQNRLHASHFVSNLHHFVSMHRILIFACCFYFLFTFYCLSSQNQNISLQSRLRNSLKNCLINKFDILIYLLEDEFEAEPMKRIVIPPLHRYQALLAVQVYRMNYYLKFVD